MKLRSLILSVAIVTVASAPAFAGTSVTNSRTVRKSVGTGYVNTNVQKYSEGVQINTSQSLKMVAEGGDVNITNVSFDGGSFTGTAHSSNLRVIDPVSIGSYSSQFEKVNFSENVLVDAVEQYRFTEKYTDHVTSSDAF